MKIKEINYLGTKFNPVTLEKIPIYEIIYVKGRKTILIEPSEEKLEKLRKRIT